MNTNTTHAIVIGGSIAGLMTARVLSQHFGRVTIVERDALPQSSDYRNGAPQARHLHVLLARGQRIMEKYFPGFEHDIYHTGAPVIQGGLNNLTLTAAGWIRRFDAGVTLSATGRASLEWLVRQRVQALPNVEFITETDVEKLLTNADGSVMTGIQLKSRRSRQAESRALFGDFVVDASGRRSKTPDWLTELGYDAPETTIVNAHTGYATRWYTLTPETTPEITMLAMQARPAEGLYRGGGYLVVEGNRLVVTLLGANEDYPPTDEAGFMEFAKSLPSPVLYDLMKTLTPEEPIYAYRGLQNQMRHYEKLARRPENFIVIGDAAIAFNPIYGQGMSSAAMEAELLDALLKKSSIQNLRGFAALFQKKQVQLTQGAWLMSTGEDMRFPLVEGQLPGMQERFFHRYTDKMLSAMAYDTVVAHAFYQVLNLLATPTALMRPDIVLRVLWHSVRHRQPEAQPQPQLQRVTASV